jgi:hypothetical protein
VCWMNVILCHNVRLIQQTPQFLSSRKPINHATVASVAAHFKTAMLSRAIQPSASTIHNICYILRECSRPYCIAARQWPRRSRSSVLTWPLPTRPTLEQQH